MVGGQPQATGNVSFARLMYKGQFDCSATIVSARWLLTAAHCFPRNPNPSKFSVQLWQGAVASSTGWSSGVSTISIDPRFVRGGDHDMAIVQTSSPMPSWAVAVPLINPSTSLAIGTGVTDYAWGRTSFPGPGTASQEVEKSPNGALTIVSCPAVFASIPGGLCLDESGSLRLYEGDSGSAILVWAAGAWQIAAVWSLYVQSPASSGPITLRPDALAWPVTPAQAADRAWIESAIGVPELPPGSIIRDQTTGHSWLVMADGYRHSIPTGGDYLCFEGQGAKDYDFLPQIVETIPQAVGSMATCSGPPPGGGGPAPTPQSIEIAWSSAHPSWITMTLSGFAPGTYTYSCDFGSGGDHSYSLGVSSNPETFDNGETCYDTIAGDTVWVTIGSVTSNTITVAGSSPQPPSPTSSSIGIGWSSAHPSWITMTLSGFAPGTYTYSCDFGSGGDHSYSVGVSSNPETFDNAETCYDTISGDTVWVTIGSVTSNTLAVASSTPPPPAPSSSSVTIGWSSAHASWITMTLSGFAPGTYTYSCDFGSGGDHSYSVGVSSNPETFDNAETCYDTISGDTVWVTIGSVTSNTIAVASSTPPPPPPPPQTYTETTGGVAHTWTNYTNAGGTQGQSIGSNQTVQIACKVTGFTVQDGNNWWYRIASAPWTDNYYVSADAFYNNGQTSGSLHGTPFVDPKVPNC
jgi:plastocyanin